MRVPALYRRLWPIGQRALGVSEHLLDSHLLLERHTYVIDWQLDSVRFEVDGVTLHQSPSAPQGNLGFIAWIDNQYAVVTPQGHFKSGVLPVPQTQTLVLQRPPDLHPAHSWCPCRVRASTGTVSSWPHSLSYGILAQFTLASRQRHDQPDL